MKKKYEFRRYRSFEKLTAEEAEKKMKHDITMAFAGFIETPIQKAIVEANSPEEAKLMFSDAEWKDDVMITRLPF